jgi:hypothetical protein
MEELPEEIIKLIWQYDGRYIQAMKECLQFFVSTSFRRNIIYNGNSYEHGDFAYIREMKNRVQNFERRMNDFGHIKGITDKKTGMIRRFRFHDIVGNYIIVFNSRHNRSKEIYHEGMLFQSVQKFPVVMIDSNKKYKKNIIEKCGIELLNPTWLKRAKRRKDSIEYIQLHMAI